MASFAMEFFLCSSPSLLFLLLSLALRWPRVHSWSRLAVRAAGWRLWVIICFILHLPLSKNTRTKATEARSEGTDILSRSSQTSEGPRLICKPTALAKYLVRHCGSLSRPRLASWPRGDPHIQTLTSLWRGPHRDMLQFTRDHLLLKDGGIVALDWAVEIRSAERRRWEGRKEIQAGRKMTPPPVLLLIPQYWGGTTPHLEGLCQQAIRQGFYVLVFHPRGTAGCPLTTARLTEFGDPADLEQALAYVHSRHPSSALFAVSEGSGSGILLSYLGESGSGSYLTAAAAISPVLLGQLWFETAMPPLYHWGALFQRKMQFRRYRSSFKGVLNVAQALRCSSLRDYEETLFCSSPKPQHNDPTCPVGSPNPEVDSGSSSSSPKLSPSVAWALGERAYPAKDWEKYWERNEPLRDADEVAVPVLCLCSSDDPLLPPSSSLPLPLFQSNPYFLLALTDRGGHCGFTLEGREEHVEGERSGNTDSDCWSHTAVLEYFRVMADFLKREDRENAIFGSPPEEFSQSGLWSNAGSMLQSRRRRNVVMRKPRQLIPEQSNLEEEEENFTWKRSYTR